MSESLQAFIFGFGFSPSPSEMLVVLVVALLLYGGKLPEVARSWGKMFAEFRRGLSSIQNDLNDVIYSEPEQIEYRDDAYYAEGYDSSEAQEAEEDADQDQEDAASPETEALVEDATSEKPVD